MKNNDPLCGYWVYLSNINTCPFHFFGTKCNGSFDHPCQLWCTPSWHNQSVYRPLAVSSTTTFIPVLLTHDKSTTKINGMCSLVLNRLLNIVHLFNWKIIRRLFPWKRISHYPDLYSTRFYSLVTFGTWWFRKTDASTPIFTRSILIQWLTRESTQRSHLECSFITLD